MMCFQFAERYVFEFCKHNIFVGIPVLHLELLSVLMTTNPSLDLFLLSHDRILMTVT